MTDETEPELQPAEQSPWYVRMTVAGPQTGDRIDWDLHKRNRRYWNGWAAQALDDKAKAKLIADGRATKESVEPGGEFAPLTDEERAAIEAALAERCPDAKTPEPTEGPDFSRRAFKATFCANGFLFPKGAFFQSATFSGPADFQSATFSNLAFFESATFSDFADFKSATFSDFADFQSATFSDFVDFQSIAFSGPARFQSATFSSTANFCGAAFSGEAEFQSATFSGSALFQSATFSGDARFQRATFSGRADFLRATFSDDADFQSATFSGSALFQSATFSGFADFSDAGFKSRTSFAPGPRIGSSPKRPPVRFARPPTFYGATLHEDTDWTDVIWPDPPTTRDEAIQFRRAYERLKLVMDDQKKFADEHFFLRKELECREIEDEGCEIPFGPRGFRLKSVGTYASIAFRRLSNYGESVSRPLSALGLAWAVGWALIFIGEWADYWLGTWPETETPEYLGFWQSAALSFSNLFAFLGLGWHIMKDELGSLTGVSELVAGIQMLVGPILLFLLALGLRNRFRIK